MQVQVNTSNGIENKETLERWANEFLNDSLSRFRQEITRIEVQLTDESSVRKGATGKHCMLEARLNGHDPLAVNHHGETQDLAFRGATQKLIRLLEHTFGKLDRHHHRARDTIRKDAPMAPDMEGVAPG
jgi:ribosome-associated translation inhibitor RaiA